ncbi:MCE family protein [Mycobacterium sp. SMC-4]|uniref:MCE family protein n=1 Tax=Mycobacterium sp. SMC-4 TaxID=2857059 RepID=UPI0021B3D396|nr:MCE family protein [Mycobacterium sp. SMC-4]UXA18854.1 MCE family protein [Mycobacterium sp. SMC-4]
MQMVKTTPRRVGVLVAVAALAVVAALGAAVYGHRLYRDMTTTSVTAYFPSTIALYPGDQVLVMGVRVGTIDAIEPDGGKSKVVLHFDNSVKVPETATASIVNPSLVASRAIQLSPAFTGGPSLADGAVIPLERTRVPVEWDDLRQQLAAVLHGLGPTPEQPRGPVGDVVSAFADGLAGTGEQLNTAFASLSEALSALNKGRGNLFSVVRNLALFVSTLRASDQQFSAFNNDLATLTDALNNSDDELARGVQEFRQLLNRTRDFLDHNGDVAVTDVDNLGQVTDALLQPDALKGLENTLHVLPTFGGNFVNIYSPVNGALTAVPVVNNFANPLQLLCSSVQAGSRLGYQESAELCAQYLAPILDAIKFNYPPFGFQPFTTASTLPKYVTYSEERLRPPPGFKDTTVPGLWARDTPLSHGNREPGWVVAPGMQGLDLQALTQQMVAPDSLAALLGGPDPAPPLAAEVGGQP